MAKLRNGSYTLGVYIQHLFTPIANLCVGLKIFTADENTVKIGNKVFLQPAFISVQFNVRRMEIVL